MDATSEKDAVLTVRVSTALMKSLEDEAARLSSKLGVRVTVSDIARRRLGETRKGRKAA